MHIPTGETLTTALASHGYPLPLNLHVVLLRNRHGVVDKFDDMILWLRGADVIHAARCTTDPGRGPRMDPKNPGGCAVWAVGQVIDGLGWGLHHGAYRCWVPRKPIPVLRYDSLEDVTGTPSISMTTQIHRASESHESAVVGAWSEGCIVYANPVDFSAARELCAGQERFTVTLLDWE